MYRFIRRAGLAVVLAVGLVGSTASPAPAATAAAGVFNGSVVFSPGLSTTPANQSFTYNNALTSGTFTNSAGGVFVGCISVTSFGSSSAPETVATGQGSFATSPASATPCAVAQVGTFSSGSLTGFYVRVGALGLIQFSGSVTINGQTGAITITKSVTVAPTTFNPTTSGTAAGTFTGAGA